MKISSCTFVLMVLFAVIRLARPICTPPDTRWTRYTMSSTPMNIQGTPTTDNGCSGGNCSGPGSVFASRLGDAYYGTTDLNVSAVHAWNRHVGDTVRITFHFNTNTTVTGISLYFYNIPSRNIGLPYNTSLSVPYTIVGNQDLSQNDNQLRNVTLIPTSDLSGTSFTAGFKFSDADKIDWLLLTEVEICTFDSGSNVTLSEPLPITFTDDTINRTYTNSNSIVSMSCSVKNQGRFVWIWTLPSGKPQKPTYILDVGRTSVIELSHVTSNDIGDYQCCVNYLRQTDESGLVTKFTITLELEVSVTTTESSIQETTMQATSPVITTAFPGGTTQAGGTPIAAVVGAICGALLVLVTTVGPVIVICVRNRRNLKKNSGIDDTDRNPSPIPIQDQYLAGYDTIQFGENVINNSNYISTDPGAQHLSVDTLDNDPETGQSISPLYASVQKNEATEEDNHGDNGSCPPLNNPLYDVAEKIHEIVSEPVSQPMGLYDKLTITQKKKQQVEMFDDKIEHFPERHYSVVQKKKKRKEAISLKEIERKSSDSHVCDLKDIYT